VALRQLLTERIWPAESPPPAALERVLALFVPRSLAKGEVVVAEGSVWGRALFIEQGLLRLAYTADDGRAYNKAFFAEGELAWPMAPKARSEPSLFTIVALEPSRLRVAPFAEFQRQLQALGRWERFALPYVERLAEEKFLREYELLLNDAEARLQAACTQLGPILHRIPDYHLASYVGINPVTLSRIRRRLRRG